MMKKIRNSQKGMALITLVLIVAMMVSFLVLVTSSYFKNMMTNEVYLRNRVYSMQIMQDFAMLARKANDSYLLQSNSCGGTTTAIPPGGHFCWDTSLGASAYCVQDPRGGNNLTTPQYICASPSNMTTNTAVNVAVMEVRDPSTDWDLAWQTAKLMYENRAKLGQKVAHDLMGLFNSSAQALPATPEVWQPTLVGAPTAPTITVPTCSGSTSGNTDCKRCSGGLGVQNLDCIEIRVCLRTVGGGGCTNPINLDEWFREEIGLIPRT